MFCSRTTFTLLVLALLVPSWSFAQEAGQEPVESAKEAPADKLGGWVDTFPGDKAASYLPKGDNTSVIVVAAGGHAEAEMAADTLEKALRSTGHFKLVMNDDVLADNAEVDDETIVQKAKHLPVGHVAVVRVFDAGEGQPPSAVVTIYDKDSGAASTAMSVTRGTPVEAKGRCFASTFSLWTTLPNSSPSIWAFVAASPSLGETGASRATGRLISAAPGP